MAATTSEREMPTTREVGDHRLHLHQVVHVAWAAVEADSISWAPSRYLITDLTYPVNVAPARGDGPEYVPGIRLVTLPLDDDSQEATVPPEELADLLDDGTVTPLYRGSVPVFGH